MSTENGVVFPGLDPNRGDAALSKLQYHRPGLMFRTEGAYAIVNKENPVRVTDYYPNNFSTTVKTSASAGDTVIALNSVKGFARYQQVMFDRGGAGEEVHYVTAIDTTAKTITLQEGLTNAQAAAKTVDFDRIKVSYAAGVTTIDIFFTGQNAVAELAGVDIYNAKVHIDDTKNWSNRDRFDGELRVPLGVNSSVVGSLMCDGCFMPHGKMDKIIDSEESASAIDPSYWLRVKFTSGAAAPTDDAKEITFEFGVWRI